MMNALPILTDGPTLAGPGVVSDPHGLSGKSNPLDSSGGFKDVMAKINAVSGVGATSKQSETGTTVARGDAAMIDGVAAASGQVKTARMPDAKQVSQLAALVQQLPQDVRQMLAQAVNQGDLQQLQLIFQRIQGSKTISNGMDENASAVETHSVDAEDVQTGPIDIQEAQKLTLAIWLMSFVRPLTQGANSGMASVFGPNTVVQNSSSGTKTLAGAEPDFAFQPSSMVSSDSSGQTVAANAGQSVLAQSGFLSSSSLSGDLRTVLERMMQADVDVKSNQTSGVSVGQSVSAQSGFLSSSSLSGDLFPPGLLEGFRASALHGDSGDLRTVLKRMMQAQADVASEISADSNQIKTANSLDLPLNKGIVSVENAVIGDGSDALMPAEPPAVSVAGPNQEKSAHTQGKQAIFADLKESLKNPFQGSAENKDVRQGEPFPSLQGGSPVNEISRPTEQDAEDRPLNDSPGLQQLTGDQKVGLGETVVVKRNVPVHAVAREAENIITKGMEEGQTLPRRVVLYLDPPELGRVRVNMVLDSGNKLSVNFVAEHASVRTVLEGHMEQLRGQLVQKGMEVSNLRVEAGGFADFASLDHGFQQNTPQERWASFKGDWPGMFSAKNNIAEEETRQAAPIFKPNINGRLHLII
ncbi:MAG: flagellar hook-length control protein FliK [Dissulfuribacterales bacterium]